MLLILDGVDGVVGSFERPNTDLISRRLDEQLHSRQMRVKLKQVRKVCSCLGWKGQLSWNCAFFAYSSASLLFELVRWVLKFSASAGSVDGGVLRLVRLGGVFRLLGFWFLLSGVGVGLGLGLAFGVLRGGGRGLGVLCPGRTLLKLMSMS